MGGRRSACGACGVYVCVALFAVLCLEHASSVRGVDMKAKANALSHLFPEKAAERTAARELEQAQARGWLDSEGLPLSSVRAGEGEMRGPSCWVVEGRDSCAPHYVVAGAMKSGTTSLFAYLVGHPFVEGLRRNAKLAGKSILANKEVRFFNDPTYSNLQKNYGPKALEMYLDVFPPISPDSGLITGEASPMYICQHGVATRIKAALPEINAIVMLRNPVDRCWSEYWFLKSLSPTRKNQAASDQDQDLFSRCFDADAEALTECGALEALKEGTEEAYARMELCLIRRKSPDFCKANNGNPLWCDKNVRTLCPPFGVKNSIYILQLFEWFNVFDREHLMIIISEDFYADTPDVMDRVVNFLGVPTHEGFDWSFTQEQAFNIMNANRGLGIGGGSAEEQGTSKYPRLRESTRRKMAAFFEPFNKALFERLGVRRQW